MRCERPDGTFYGTSGTCRKGTEAGAKEEKGVEDWREINPRKYPEIASEVKKLSDELDKIPEHKREFWDKEIRSSFNDSTLMEHTPPRTGERGKEYTREEQVKALKSQVNSWLALIRDPYPSKIVDRAGNHIPVSPNMAPFVTGSGTRGWINYEIGNGRKFSPPKTAIEKRENIWRQNRAGLEDTGRVAEHIVAFRKSQTLSGKQWPTQEISRKREDTGLAGWPNPTKVYENLSASERSRILKVGLNATANEGKVLLEYYSKHPKEAEQRVRGIVDRYVAQGGYSGVSGKPIPLPGLPPKPGEEKSTVDHFNPISTVRTDRSFRAEDYIKHVDNGKNFLLAEEGPNQQRSNGTWDKFADKLAKAQGSSGSGSNGSTQGAVGARTAPTGSPRASIASRGSTSQAAKPTLDQAAQLGNLIKKLSKMDEKGLSDEEKKSKLSPAEIQLMGNFAL